jgi:hypothetical protein
MADDAEGAAGDLSPMPRAIGLPAAGPAGSFVWHFGHSFLSAFAACLKHVQTQRNEKEGKKDQQGSQRTIVQRFENRSAARPTLQRHAHPHMPRDVYKV